MKSIPRLLAFALAATGASLPVHAHPGHSHTDIPSLIRHPFAGPEHVLGSAACGLAIAGLLYALTRRLPMPAVVRWGGLSVVAIGVTLLGPV